MDLSQYSKVMEQIEQMWMRALIVDLCISVIAFIVVCWVAYSITRAAVRDGIRDALPRFPVANNKGAPPDGFRWELVKDDAPKAQMPDMRAEK